MTLLSSFKKKLKWTQAEGKAKVILTSRSDFPHTVTQVRARWQDVGELHYSSSWPSWGWLASTSAFFTSWQSPAIFTFWKHGHAASLHFWPLTEYKHLSSSSLNTTLKTRTHCRVGATSVLAVCREAGLFKSWTFQRGLFLVKGRPMGFEAAFLNIQTWQIEAPARHTGMVCFQQNTTNFLKFIYWQFQVLGIQKNDGFCPWEAQSGERENTLQKPSGSFRW